MTRAKRPQYIPITERMPALSALSQSAAARRAAIEWVAEVLNEGWGAYSGLLGSEFSGTLDESETQMLDRASELLERLAAETT